MQEYDLFIPLFYTDGTPIESTKLQDLQARLLDEFGGLTFFPQFRRVDRLALESLGIGEMVACHRLSEFPPNLLNPKGIREWPDPIGRDQAASLYQPPRECGFSSIGECLGRWQNWRT